MLPTSPTLVEAARSGSATPYVRVRLSDRDAGVPRLRFERWHAGGEPDGPAGVAQPADGSLVRARIDPGTSDLLVQRVATPVATSDYGTWSSLATASASAGLGAHAAGTRVLLAYYDGTAVRVRESVSSGVSYGSAAALVFAGGVTAVGCAVRSDGAAVAAWATGGVVYVATRPAGGAWGSPASWSHTLASVSGVAVSDLEDWALLVSGVDVSGVPGCWSTRYGSGAGGPPGHWSALRPVAAASPGLGVAFRASAVTSGGAPRAALVESYAGTGAFDRVMLTAGLAGGAFEDGDWREPAPFEHASPWGLAAASGASGVYLSAAAGLWYASGIAVPEDITPAIIEARHDASFEAERLSLVMDAGLAGTPPGLVVGGEVEFGAGYVTDAGLEVAAGRSLWITSILRSRRDGRATVEVEAEGALGRLARERASRQVSWAAGTRAVETLAAEIARAAGVRVASGTVSAAASTLTPGLSVRPGQSWASALVRLLERVPDRVAARGAELTLAEDDAGEVAGYEYGTAHAVHRIALREAPREPGAVRVLGTGVVGEAVGGAAGASGGSVAVVVDSALVAAPQAADRAAAVLRRAELAEELAVIEAAPHPGQEPGDVVAVTDATLGLAAQPYRVQSVRIDFASRPRGRYLMRLQLGAV